MKIKKHFTYNSRRQIFRIIISDSDKLIVESRNMNTREVYFDCYDLYRSNKIFTDYQLDEKSWVGIEAEHRGVIYFHKYGKPDMPAHLGIIAFDIERQKILWINSELSFLFPFENKIYCYKQGFEERRFYCLNASTGELIEDLGNDFKLVNSLRSSADAQKDWSLYSYPEQLFNADERIKSIIGEFLKKYEIEGNVEYCIKEKTVLFNYHVKNKKGYFDNIFNVVNIDSGRLIMDKTLNTNTARLYTDSFFIYKNLLFLLKEKDEINIFTLE